MTCARAFQLSLRRFRYWPNAGEQESAKNQYFWSALILLRAIRIGVNNELLTPEEHFQIRSLAFLFTELWFALKIELINRQLICKVESSEPSLSDYVLKIKDVLEFQCR